MAKEGTEKTQISWGSLGTKLFADVPGSNERVYFEMSDLHESWKDFMSMYGVKQFVSSALAKESYGGSKELKSQLIRAQIDAERSVEDTAAFIFVSLGKDPSTRITQEEADKRAPEYIASAQKEVITIREKIRAEKAVWLKSNAANLRTALWNELQSLKNPMEQKAKSEKESKAQAVERARQELIAKTRASLEAAGMPEDFIQGIIANL